MSATPSERVLAARIAAHEKWGRCTDTTAATAPARKAMLDKFLAEADGDPARAEHLKKAHFQRLALKSAQARRKIKTLTADAEAAEAELSAGTP